MCAYPQCLLPRIALQIQLPLMADDKKKVVEDVSKERTHAVDAAIVRTMKSRKKLGLTQVPATALRAA